ncbi:MAG: EAL domain-containing protein [Actinobacteria bacterium]|nr:EAL domain-containing protein [Actinomycetota bacterium]
MIPQGRGASERHVVEARHDGQAAVTAWLAALTDALELSAELRAADPRIPVLDGVLDGIRPVSGPGSDLIVGANRLLGALRGLIADLDAAVESAHARSDELGSLLDSVSMGLLIVDRDGVVRWGNRLAASFLRSPPQTLTGAVLGIPIIGSHPLPRLELIEGTEVTSTPLTWQGEPCQLVSIRGVRSGTTGSSLAAIDPLTGLPNRAGFETSVRGIIDGQHVQGPQVGMMFIDLDGFKEVNDTWGHRAGDEVLRIVARRISHALRASDLLARVGGDEFAVWVDGITGRGEIEAVAARITATLDRDIHVDEQLISVGLSIGIYLDSMTSQEGPADFAEMLELADLAMYEAKSLGPGRFSFFTSDLQERNNDRVRLHKHVRQALEKDQFELHYQPIVTPEREVVGHEALLRARGEDLEKASPAEIVAICEESGLIRPLGRYVTRTALDSAQRWAAAREPVIVAGRRLLAPFVSVNVSAAQISHEQMLADLEQAIIESQLDGAQIVLELTETWAIGDPEVAAERLQRLRSLGVALAIDDFGTAYSSLAYLRILPCDFLKLDQAFTQNVCHSRKDLTIAHAQVQLARGLGLATIAEGVELQEQHDALVALGVDLLQGFLYSRPQPEHALASADPGMNTARSDSA